MCILYFNFFIDIIKRNKKFIKIIYVYICVYVFYIYDYYWNKIYIEIYFWEIFG